MKNYEVSLPIAGYVLVQVEAADRTEALNKALASKIKLTDIEEWETYRIIAEGNVFHGIQNEYDVYEI